MELFKILAHLTWNDPLAKVTEKPNNIFSLLYGCLLKEHIQGAVESCKKQVHLSLIITRIFVNPILGGRGSVWFPSLFIQNLGRSVGNFMFSGNFSVTQFVPI